MNHEVDCKDELMRIEMILNAGRKLVVQQP